MTAQKILSIAQAEIGVTEYPANSNKVKYNTDYYGSEVSGSAYPWCCAFVWWVFKQAGASDLFYGGGKTAYCPTLLSYHKGKGQAVTGDYKPGDVIFFNFSGGSNAAHVGICESWDGAYITCIEGNTGSTSAANGGAVMRQKRAKKYIVGAYRPAYGTINATPMSTTGTVTASSLNIRSGPGISYSVIGGLTKGCTVSVTGSYNGWYKIKSGSADNAWVSAQYITIHTQTTEQEDDDMVTYKTLDDVPSYYKDAVKKVVDKGVLNGDGDGLNVSEDLCRTLTVLDRLGKLD